MNSLQHLLLLSCLMINMTEITASEKKEKKEKSTSLFHMPNFFKKTTKENTPVQLPDEENRSDRSQSITNLSEKDDSKKINSVQYGSNLTTPNPLTRSTQQVMAPEEITDDEEKNDEEKSILNPNELSLQNEAIKKLNQNELDENQRKVKAIKNTITATRIMQKENEKRNNNKKGGNFQETSSSQQESNLAIIAELNEIINKEDNNNGNQEPEFSIIKKEENDQINDKNDQIKEENDQINNTKDENEDAIPPVSEISIKTTIKSTLKAMLEKRNNNKDEFSKDIYEKSKKDYEESLNKKNKNIIDQQENYNNTKNEDLDPIIINDNNSELEIFTLSQTTRSFLDDKLETLSKEKNEKELRVNNTTKQDLSNSRIDEEINKIKTILKTGKISEKDFNFYGTEINQYKLKIAQTLQKNNLFNEPSIKEKNDCDEIITYVENSSGKQTSIYETFCIQIPTWVLGMFGYITTYKKLQLYKQYHQETLTALLNKELSEEIEDAQSFSQVDDIIEKIKKN